MTLVQVPSEGQAFSPDKAKCDAFVKALDALLPAGSAVTTRVNTYGWHEVFVPGRFARFAAGFYAAWLVWGSPCICRGTTEEKR
jgi:hypothetical protein